MHHYNTIYYTDKGDYFLKEGINTYFKYTQKEILGMVDKGFFPLDVKFKKIRPKLKKKFK